MVQTGPVSLSFLRLQPICNCSSLIFLKITCSCLARERTAVSVRFIRMPIALELSPVLIGRIHSLPQAVDANRALIGDRTIMKTLLMLVLSMASVAREATAQDAQCDRERAAMVETIRAYARSDAGVLGQQGLSERVLEAMGQTKRHLFIPERSCSIAYTDSPIPIGLGQTISQPIVVALMTQLAEAAPDHLVLEA